MVVETKIQNSHSILHVQGETRLLESGQQPGCFVKLAEKIRSFIKWIFHFFTCNRFRHSELDRKGIIQANFLEKGASQGRVSWAQQMSPTPLEKKLLLYEFPKLTLEEVKEQRRAFLDSKDAKSYPTSLDKILDKGFLHLYYYLLNGFSRRRGQEIEGCPKDIAGLSPSAFSRVILEVRHAIVEHVKELVKRDHPNVVFLVGETGDGKSTTLAFLRGDPLQRTGGGKYRTSADIVIDGGLESVTLIPNVYVNEQDAYVDFPGFNDSRGEPVRLGIELAFRALVSFYQPKVVLVTSIEAPSSGWGDSLADLGRELERMLGRSDLCPLFITKYLGFYPYSKLKNAPLKKQQIRAKIQQLESKIRQEEEEIRKIEANVEDWAQLPANIQNLLTENIRSNRAEIQTLRSEIMAQNAEVALCDESIASCPAELEEQRLKIFKLLRIGNPEHPFATLAELEDPATLESCRVAISQAEPIRFVRTELSRTRRVELIKIINQSFEKRLLPVPLPLELDNLEQRVLETSLISVLTAEVCPEIQELLHLPEMEPTCFKEIDQFIVPQLELTLLRFVALGPLWGNCGIVDLILQRITFFAERRQAGASKLSLRWKAVGSRLIKINSLGGSEWRSIQGTHRLHLRKTLEGLDEDKITNFENWDRWIAEFFGLPDPVKLSNAGLDEVAAAIDCLSDAIVKLKKLKAWVRERGDCSLA